MEHSPAAKPLLLAKLHHSLGARFAPFAGYDMPVQYEGILAEHSWVRAKAGLFDVSHMGPAFLRGMHAENFEEVARRLERLVPSDIAGLKPGQQRYSVLLNDQGGIEDDLIIGRPVDQAFANEVYLVVNAGCKEADFASIAEKTGLKVYRADDRALLALQGPLAHAALERLVPGIARLFFMQFAIFDSEFGRLLISRSGYTGEDGFEVLVLPEFAEAFAKALLDQPEVKPIGLGARDTLRLEAGLCLYGHDLDADTSPIAADLAWAIQKRRRLAGDFPGATRILSEIANGPPAKRVGLILTDRAPAREGAQIQAGGRVIGRVTSGGFAPSLQRAISMGYVEAAFAQIGERVEILVRGQPREAEITALPFVSHRYVKG